MLVAVAAETVFLIEPADKPQGAVYIAMQMKRALGLAFKTTSNCASTFSQRYVSSHTQRGGGKFAIGLSEAVKRVRRHDCVKVYAYVGKLLHRTGFRPERAVCKKLSCNARMGAQSQNG